MWIRLLLAKTFSENLCTNFIFFGPEYVFLPTIFLEISEYAICVQNIGSVTHPISVEKCNYVNFGKETSRSIFLSGRLDIVLGGSGWGQEERLVNLGHNQPSLNQVSEVPDHELILNKTNKRATLSDFIMMMRKSNCADNAISPSIDQTKMIDTPTLDWIIGGGGI